MTDTMTVDLSRGEWHDREKAFYFPDSLEGGRKRKTRDPWRLEPVSEQGEGWAEMRNRCLSIGVRAGITEPDTARLTYRPASERGRIRRMVWARPLASELVAETSLNTFGVAPPGRAFFRFLLSWHYYERPIPYEIRYVLVPGATGKSVEIVDPGTVRIILPCPPGSGNVEFDLLEAARLLRNGDDTTIREVEWGVETVRGAEVSMDFCSLRMWNRRHDIATYHRTVQGILDRYADVYDVIQYMGGEFAWSGTHLNAFYPDSAIAPSLLGGEYRDLAIDEWVSRVHDRGGLVSLNHPFGTGSELFPAYQQLRDQLHIGRARIIAKAQAYGADILEVGYLTRGGVTLHEHLLLWDLLTAKGLFLYGNGTSDSHGGIWTPEENPNYFVTWVWATDSTPEELVRGMRRGRMFFGDRGRWNGRFDFWLGPHRAGDRVPVPGKALPLSVLLDPLPEGASIRLVQGAIEPGVREVRYTDSPTPLDPSGEVDIRIDEPCFVRLEVYITTEEEEGVPLLFSNPIVFQ